MTWKGLAPRATRQRRAMASGEITREVDLQRQIVDLAGIYGWHHYHNLYAVGSDPGYPDLTLVHPERGVCWVEVKVKARVSPAQQAWLALLRAAGQRAYVIRPDDLEMLRTVLAGETRSPATGTGGTGEDGR